MSMAGAARDSANPIMPRFEFVRACDMEIKPIVWAVRGLLALDSLGMIFSDPGGRKTFLAIDLACSVATGTPWHGCTVTQGPVFILAGEGFNGLRHRIRAWEKDRGVPLDEAPLFISKAPAALCDPMSVIDVLAGIKHMVESTGEVPELVVIDTAARNFGPGDENSTKDMGAFVAGLDALRAEWGCCILVIHHTGHADKSRARGAMALKGALDFEYCATTDETGITRLVCTKIKDHQAPDPRAFRLTRVDLGLVDDEGAPVTSAVLNSVAFIAPPKPGKVGRGRNQTLALRVLQDLHDEHRARLGASDFDADQSRVAIHDWRARCIEEGVDRKRWPEVLQSLRDAGLVRLEYGFAWPSECPK